MIGNRDKRESKSHLIRVSAAAVVLLLFITGCEAKITGQVRDFDTGEPIPGATVHVTQIRFGIQEYIDRSSTDREGRFTVAYRTWESSVQVGAGCEGYVRFEAWYYNNQHVAIQLRRHRSSLPRLEQGLMRVRLMKNGTLFGWNFSAARAVSSESEADILPTHIDPDTWGPIGVRACGLGGVRFISEKDLGVDNMFLNYTDEAPATGYADSLELPFRSLGGVLFVRTRDGRHFAKVNFNANSYGGMSGPDIARDIDFYYVYNDSPTRDLRYESPWAP